MLVVLILERVVSCCHKRLVVSCHKKLKKLMCGWFLFSRRNNFSTVSERYLVLECFTPSVLPICFTFQDTV